MVPHGEGLAAFYRAADVFVLPSVSEGTPKVLLEAMANALPVVATDVGGVSTIVEDGANGLLVPPKSPSDLASAVRRVVGDGDLRRRIIAGGLTAARQHTLEGETARMVEAVRAEFGEPRGRSQA
jgi:glycosyltransferase involved in cell wall biosynthesis